MNTAAPPPNTAPLWERLRATFGRVIAAIGAPAAIALLSFSSRCVRIDILRQLAMLESLARKMLFTEVAALAAAPGPRGPRIVEIPVRPGLVMINPARKRASVTPRPIDLARPETWSAPFALALPRDTRRVSDRHAPRIRALWGATPPSQPEARAPRNTSPTPLRIARRFEALRRVLNDPAPHVRRLAAAQRRALGGHQKSSRAMRSWRRDAMVTILKTSACLSTSSAPRLTLAPRFAIPARRSS